MQWQQSWTRLTALLIIAALLPWPLLLGPGNWWTFVLVIAAILAALRLLLGRQWTSWAGLNLPPTYVLTAVIVFAVVATGSKMLLPIVYAAAGLKAKTPNIGEQTGFCFRYSTKKSYFAPS